MGVDYSRYPFLTTLQDYMIRRLGYSIPLDELLDNQELTDASFERIKNAVEGRVYAGASTTSEMQVLSFHVALFIVKTTESRWLRNRFAMYESERAYEFLKSEDGNTMVEVLRASGLNAGKLADPYKLVIGFTRSMREIYELYDYTMFFVDYLKYTKRFWGESKWKLVNRLLWKGRVYVKREELARIGKEVFYALIQELLDKAEFMPATKLEELAEKVRRIIPTRYAGEGRLDGFEGSPGKRMVVEAFPPCMKRIYTALVRGDNLSHHERFAIATFLISLGMDLEDIINLFRRVPDFNERITRYQLEHLAGKRGGGRRYAPYNCDNMRSRGLCVSECNVRHPLSYYYSSLKKLFKDQASPRGVSRES